MLWLRVAAALLALRQFDLLRLRGLVRNLAQQVRDDVQPGALLVVRPHYIPWGELEIGGCEHFVAGARIVVPAAIGLQIHRRELPDLARIVDAVLQTAGALFPPSP